MTEANPLHMLLFCVCFGGVMLGIVAYFANRLKSGEPFGILEKLGMLYVGGVLLAWVAQWLSGTPAIGAMLPALIWPLTAGKWLMDKVKKSAG